MARAPIKRAALPPPVARSYFAPPVAMQFVPTGCTLLDLAIGGGWPMGRVSNIVGDRSTAKTGLAVEACANFARSYPKGSIKYREAEDAFDTSYAEVLGMPLDRVDLSVKLDTVEDFAKDLVEVIKTAPKPCLYVLDSLDALSDDAEMARKVGEASYGMAKAKLLSELFRKHNSAMAREGVTLLVVSQIRSNVDARAFGKQWTRAGGRALDFYASVVVYLAKIATVTREVAKIKRPTGIVVEAKLDKNKVSLPFRSATFEVAFGYGVDDHKACVTFLDKHGGLRPGEKPVELLERLRIDDGGFYDEVKQRVAERWHQIEHSFLPTKRKYT